MLLDAHLFLKENAATASVMPFAGGTVAVISRRCPGVERPNQDAAAVLPIDEDRGLLVVADGVGGERDGDRAAALVVQHLRESIAAAEPERIRSAVLDGIEAANRAVLEMGQGAATTVSVVEIGPDRIRPYQVGDSLVVQLGQKGRVKFRSMPHSPVGYAVAAGLLEEDEALHHDQLHIVANVVGCPEMHVEVGAERPLAARDTLLLASDGLADNLTTEEIVEGIRAGDLGPSVESLADAAAKRMAAARIDPAEADTEHEFHVGRAPSKPDDLTIIAFRPGSYSPSTGTVPDG